MGELSEIEHPVPVVDVDVSSGLDEENAHALKSHKLPRKASSNTTSPVDIPGIKREQTSSTLFTQST